MQLTLFELKQIDFRVPEPRGQHFQYFLLLVLTDFVVLCKFRQLQLSFRSKKRRVFRMPDPKNAVIPGKNQKMKFFDFYPESVCGRKILQNQQ
jgi:hypothetical protein